MLDKNKIKKNIDLQNEYRELLNFIKESRLGCVVFDLKINHKEIFSTDWKLFCKKKEISKDALINVLEELIKRQDEEFERIIKQDEVEVI